MKTLGHDFGTTPMGWHQIAAVHAARGSEAMAGRGGDVDGCGAVRRSPSGASQFCTAKSEAAR